MTPSAAQSPAPQVERRTSIIGNIIRGIMIGVVETVPGVSGGTVALVVGIYTQLIDSASHFVSAVRRLVTGPNRLASAAEQFRKVQWKLVIPVLLGMAPAVFLAAGLVVDIVDTYPTLTRAAFFGMVLASIGIPLSMAGIAGIRIIHILAGIVAAAATFWLVSLPPTHIEPTPVVIVVAAAVAVCALLLPGLSGSFLLLTFGLYEPTLRAVSDRDLAYIGLFLLGLIIGAAAFVKVLQWLLHHWRRVTLVVLTGMMVGAMRTLWPWQSEHRELLAPADDWSLALLFGVLGFVVVLTLVIIDIRLSRRNVLEKMLNEPSE